MQLSLTITVYLLLITFEVLEHYFQYCASKQNLETLNLRMWILHQRKVVSFVAGIKLFLAGGIV